METILLVDDEPEQLRSLKWGLLSNGYTTMEASNGPSALEKLNAFQARIDMVITDFAMPGMDGLELLNKIKKKCGAMPVMIMTAYGEKKLVVKALRNRCDSFIEKPFELQELIAEIERVKKQKASASEPHHLMRVLPRLVHQINNPLSAISGYAELALSDLGDQGMVKKGFQSIIEATSKIQIINQQILDLGRPPSNEQLDQVNIADLVRDALAMFSSLISARKILIEEEFEDDNLLVVGSRNALEQTFRNLIMNAIDAMSESSSAVLKINVSTDRKKTSALIRIADTGCGISEDALPKIFDPYFSRKKNGNGLGLAIAKEAIESHGGKIEVDSLIGKGTLFTIELPVSDNDPENGKPKGL